MLDLALAVKTEESERTAAQVAEVLRVGDHLHGPSVAGRKAYPLAVLDDHSRAAVGYRWAAAEDTVRVEAALRAALAARGLPEALYLDNGGRSSTPSCCAPARCWGSGWCTPGPADPT